MRLRSNLCAQLCAFALFLCVCRADAQVRPNGRWRQLDTKHFHIVYDEGLDSLALHASRRAEEEWVRLNAGLIRAPDSKIDIVITDATDITNGYAMQWPTPRINIFARPPVEEMSLQNYDDWIDLVVTHELTHIFHLDQAGRFGRALRSLFGRLPLTWPVFPAEEQPRWNMEGLATMVESQHTSAGRVKGSYHEMVVRTGIAENQFDPLDRVSGETPIWPGGTRAYIYGSLFMDFIARHYGEQAHTQLIKKTAGSVLPPSWRLDAIAKKATGKSYSQLYREWQDELRATYSPLMKRLRDEGLTQTETITTAGRLALHPRISPNGRFLAITDENGKQVTATRIIDLQTKQESRIRRNGVDVSDWIGDSTFVTAQYEFDGAYEIYSDLYRGTTRLTRGERAESPDVSPDASVIAYVQNKNGTNGLMLRGADGQPRVLVEASPDAQWILPRFSPDGSRIAAQRWTRSGGHEITIVDPDHSLHSIQTSGIDAAPAWTNDGNWIVFSSDRTGINNLYAAHPDGSALKQITNVIGGAFYPEISPDSKWLYFSAYHADGFHIERMPFDSTKWRAPQPESAPNAARQDTIRAADVPSPPLSALRSTPYSALRSALPHFWVPDIFGDTIVGTFFGVSTAGEDDVGRHSYEASIAYAPETERVAGNIAYTYAGLGVPLMMVTLARDWESYSDGTFRHEDLAALDAVFPVRQWRRAFAAQIGIENSFVREQSHIGVRAGAAFSNARMPAYAISPEDGVRANLFARRRFNFYDELNARASAYKSVDAFGFAHHVLAVRGSLLLRSKKGGLTDVGGVSEFLPVRGFASGARYGWHAWSASAEYRLPLALVGRGYHLRPLFLDRLSMSAFFDAGNARGYVHGSGTTLMSTGVELYATGSVLTFLQFPMRLGVAYPLQGEHDKRYEVYFALGRNF